MPYMCVSKMSGDWEQMLSGGGSGYAHSLCSMFCSMLGSESSPNMVSD